MNEAHKVSLIYFSHDIVRTYLMAFSWFDNIFPAICKCDSNDDVMAQGKKRLHIVRNLWHKPMKRFKWFLHDGIKSNKILVIQSLNGNFRMHIPATRFQPVLPLPDSYFRIIYLAVTKFEDMSTADLSPDSYKMKMMSGGFRNTGASYMMRIVFRRLVLCKVWLFTSQEPIIK